MLCFAHSPRAFGALQASLLAAELERCREELAALQASLSEQSRGDSSLA
jgi:hypothetical protein